ncbi:BHLH domain-containing protein [Heracleum sosnowskyi]|uniref:BHLH domain-containing protein n=1 Tax=Heracleum sosnowskyi TaxID=360622 RepID=A0AAD8IEY2_9APIA|nr:BHLH domain-containing protein [Heracleum sosnowskyi]
MDIVGCGNLGFENWNEGFLDCSSADAFADPSTEKFLGDTLGLELTCKPFKCEQRLVNAHVEQITHPSQLGTGSFLEMNTCMISHESQQKGYSGSPSGILEGRGGNECSALLGKGIYVSSANGKKRKKVFHERSQLAQSKDQRKIFKGEGSDGKQITGKSPKSNSCCKLEDIFGKESSNTTNNLKEDDVDVKTKCIQSINNHSRAERIRREKINERMKFLQDIVPGCSKINGKAAMLDEIINYVLSLQQQIDLLSRKVATLSSDVKLDNQQTIQS